MLRADGGAEGGERGGDGAQSRRRALEEEQSIVGQLGKCRPELERAVPEAALVTAPEARAVAEGRVPERGEQQVVRPASSEVGGLGAVDELLEQLLLFRRP